MSQITLRPVGRINSKNGCFTLNIRKEFTPALKALEGFGHIQVLWWADESDTREKRSALIAPHPYKNAPEQTGIFATRSPTRPNPVMITTTALNRVDMETGILELSWIDARQDSPVIDIKPYQPCFDRLREVRLPQWCRSWPQWQEDSNTFDWSSVFNF